MDTPCRSDKETHSAAEQVVRRAPFAPSPCSRGVASETGGRGGLVPRKAFSFGNLSEARRSTGELGEARANRRRAGRSQGESPESWAKPGRSPGEPGESPESWAKPGRSPGEPGEAPPGFSNLCQVKGRMSVKNRKDGFIVFMILYGYPLTLCRKNTLCRKGRW